jgi:hypothetical protein
VNTQLILFWLLAT